MHTKVPRYDSDVPKYSILCTYGSGIKEEIRQCLENCQWVKHIEIIYHKKNYLLISA